MGKGNVSVFIPHLGCPHACSFCDQRSISSEEGNISPSDAREIIKGAYEYMTDKSETEIAFFGGSFTAIDRRLMTKFLTVAEEYVGNGGFKGIRISTRPDCIDKEISVLLKAHKVTAVELGAQSMKDEVLIKNRRGHTADDVRKSTAILKDFGFETGLQIMTGLYGSSPEDDIYTINEAAALAPDTVRLYPTAIIDGTYLGELFKSGEYVPYSFEKCIEICAYAFRLFHEKDIKLLRAGLHAEKSLEKRLLGGFYHPAFGELIRSRLFKEAFCSVIPPKTEKAEITVASADRSCAAGHKKENLAYFSKQGTRLFIYENPCIERDHFSYNGQILSIFDKCCSGSVICT